jgi:hypothetical protein
MKEILGNVEAEFSEFSSQLITHLALSDSILPGIAAPTGVTTRGSPCTPTCRKTPIRLNHPLWFPNSLSLSFD